MQFRGHDNNGTRKQTYGQQIAEKIKGARCRIERSADAVVKKIQEIEGRFIKAHDWVNNTGQGVKENETAETFEGLVRARCKWYFELAPIMGDRSKARPKVTTDSLDIDNLSSLDISEDDGSGSATEKEISKSVGTSAYEPFVITNDNAADRVKVLSSFKIGCILRLWSERKGKECTINDTYTIWESTLFLNPT